MKLLLDIESEKPVYIAGRKGPGRKELWILLVLLGFGACQSVIFFGQFPVPMHDFTRFLQTGREILFLQIPASFRRGPLTGFLLALLEACRALLGE